MDSYLANIDAYMQQKQREEEEKEKQQQQQQNTDNMHNNSNFASVSSPMTMDNIWLNYIPTSNAPTTTSTTTMNTVTHNNTEPNAFYNPVYMSPPYYVNTPANINMIQSTNVNSTDFNPSTSHLSSPPPLPPAPSELLLDADGQPIRIRKKPGRKPNPTSPALRKAQNRAAQRAFRERKESHLRDLETTIRQLREQRSATTRELKTVKKSLEATNAENWYLKGLVLTLQFVCMHHNIQIPAHSPYLTDDYLQHIGLENPHATEAYINAYTKNNRCLNEPIAAAAATDEAMPIQQQQQGKEQENHKIMSLPSSDMPSQSATTSQDAIEHLRLELKLQKTLSDASINDRAVARLKPTALQLAIPDHDPRIDLIPTPHMRDRMIIFRDQMNYNRCFELLLNGCVFHGGDPTESESWELPAEFFSEFWYLTLKYDVGQTNKWRRLKGLNDVALGPQRKTCCELGEESRRHQTNHDSPIENIVDLMSCL
ncbi:MAG: hypothetical protein EXX96DRAFT_559699 [Benjaminiella poitrasii]|nr:MAG: hypothetical protein EXX96DRAFT_559699 [Benjaminiella poitrasii]